MHAPTIEPDLETPPPVDDDPPADDDDDPPADDDDDPPADDDDDPPPPHDASAERLMEERGKKLDKLSAYVARKLTEIFGEEEADSLLLCELCTWTQTHGYRPDMLPPEAVREAVKLAIGLGTLDELLSYSSFTTCETCNGLGNVKTGSQVTGHLFRPCPSCKGRGYSSALAEDANMPPPATPVAAIANAHDGVPASSPDFDQFGTPRSHPDYGKMVQHREVPISEWSSNLPTS